MMYKISATVDSSLAVGQDMWKSRSIKAFIYIYSCEMEPRLVGKDFQLVTDSEIFDKPFCLCEHPIFIIFIVFLLPNFELSKCVSNSPNSKILMQYLYNVQFVFGQFLKFVGIFFSLDEIDIVIRNLYPFWTNNGIVTIPAYK